MPRTMKVVWLAIFLIIMIGSGLMVAGAPARDFAVAMIPFIVASIWLFTVEKPWRWKTLPLDGRGIYTFLAPFITVTFCGGWGFWKIVFWLNSYGG